MLLFAIGCSDLINESDLESKRGLMYNPKNSKPYSGKVYKLYSTGSKMREGVFDLGAIDGSYTYYDNEGSIDIDYKERIGDSKLEPLKAAYWTVIRIMRARFLSLK